MAVAAVLGVGLTGCVSGRGVPAVRGVEDRPAVAGEVSAVGVVPFPRGIVAMEGGAGGLVVLSRGRVRDAGGTEVGLHDHAGTLWVLGWPKGGDVPLLPTVLAEPTDPPMNLLDRRLPTALDDHRTDRPYCILRFDAATRSYYFCAFSGIDKPLGAEGGYFRKNATDAVFRYDLRTGRYHLLSRGLPLDGPNNCLVVGRWLFVANKESSTVVRYDLLPLVRDPEARLAAPVVVVSRHFRVEGERGGERAELLGHSMLAYREGKLYVGFRTSSAVVRIDLPRSDARPPTAERPLRAELLARFEPYSERTGRSADLTDMAFGPEGRLYVVGAKPARVWRFFPDPGRPYLPPPGMDNPPAWAELHRLTGNPQMKIESLAVTGSGDVYVTSADPHPLHGSSGLRGVIYRIAAGAGTTPVP